MFIYYVCTYACMHACMHGWMDGWMYVCMYVYVYICIYICVCDVFIIYIVMCIIYTYISCMMQHGRPRSLRRASIANFSKPRRLRSREPPREPNTP